MSEFGDDIIEDDLDYEVEIDELNEAEEEALLAGNELDEEQEVDGSFKTAEYESYKPEKFEETKQDTDFNNEKWENEISGDQDFEDDEERPDTLEEEEEEQEEIEDEEDEEEKGDRDRFKSERTISLTGLKSDRVIPDSLDEVQTKDNLQPPKKPKFKRNKQQNRPQMRPNFPLRMMRPPLMMRPPFHSPWLPNMAPSGLQSPGGMMPFWSDGPFHEGRFQQPLMPPLEQWAPKKAGLSVHQRLAQKKPQQQTKKRPPSESNSPTPNPAKKRQLKDKTAVTQSQTTKPVNAVKPQPVPVNKGAANPNLKTVQTVETQNAASGNGTNKVGKSEPVKEEPDLNLTDEDLEYKRKLEEQKKKREEILARKEERRKAAAALNASTAQPVIQVEAKVSEPQQVAPPKPKIALQSKNMKQKKLKRLGVLNQQQPAVRLSAPQNFNPQRPLRPSVDTSMPPPNFQQQPPPLLPPPSFPLIERPPVRPQGMFNVPPPLNLLPAPNTPLQRPPPSLPPHISNPPPPMSHAMPPTHLPPPALQREPPMQPPFMNVPPPSPSPSNFSGPPFMNQNSHNPHNPFVVEHANPSRPEVFSSQPPPPNNFQPIRKDIRSRLGAQPSVNKNLRESFLTPVPQQASMSSGSHQQNQNPHLQRVKKFKRVTRRRKNGDVILVKQVILDAAGKPTGKEIVEYINEELLTDSEKATYSSSLKNVVKTSTKIINSPRKAPPHNPHIGRNNGMFMPEAVNKPFQNRMKKAHSMSMMTAEAPLHPNEFHVERPPLEERRVVRTVPLTKRFEQSPMDNSTSVVLSNLPATINVPEIQKTIRSSGFDMPLGVHYDRGSHTCRVDFTNPNIAREFTNKMDGCVLKLSIIKAHRV